MKSDLSLGILLLAAAIARLILKKLVGPDRYRKLFVDYISPLSLLGLLFTVIILFASQGRK